jgi:hypothetical protein
MSSADYPSSCAVGTRGSLPVNTSVGRERDYIHLVPKLSLHGAIPLHFHMP